MFMGSETEFGILDGWTLAAAEGIQRNVEERHRHLPSARTGVFLENGGCAYVDQGKHNEYGTPEVEDPLTLVGCELAGRELMQEAARAHGRALLCSNVDYPTRNSWGTHENYECSHDLSPAGLAVVLTHLATRIVFTGAGGPDPMGEGGSLVLSPRASLTQSACSVQGQPSKAMIFDKPDQYGAKRRLHVISGESLLCPRASWLKYGTTALVAFCADAGLLDPMSLAVSDALRTLHGVNRDLRLTLRFPMSDGRQRTSLEIQHRLADAVDACGSSTPAWAGDVVRVWRETLDRLAAGDPRLPGSLDWLLYRRLWSRLATEQGLDPARLEARRGRSGLPPHTIRRRLRKRYPQFCAYARALYVRLHALDDSSPLAAQAETHWMPEPLPGLGEPDVRAFLRTAPPGRAGNRARLVVRLHRKPGHFATWGAIYDRGRGRRCEIPRDAEWSGRARWEMRASGSTRYLDRRATRDLLATLLRDHRVRGTIGACFRAGYYVEALDGRALDPGDRPEALDGSTLALSYARLGREREAASALAAGAGSWNDRTLSVLMELFCSVNYGLVPRLELCSPLAARARRLGQRIDPERPEIDYWRAVLHQSAGWVRLHEGRSEEAVAELTTALAELDRSWRPRMRARTLCFLAEAQRRRGHERAAAAHAAEAARIYVTEELVGDAADHYVPVRIKLGSRREARHWLRAAEALDRRRHHGLALARVLCLSARIRPDASVEAEVRRLAGEVEALRSCPLLSRILANWAAWVGGHREPGEDEFWGL